MGFVTLPPTEVGCPIPENTPHAVSVTLPTWEATVAYEEGEDWVVKKMTSGYPRFFVHSRIQELCAWAESRYGRPGEVAWAFPTYDMAKRCREFVLRRNEDKTAKPKIRITQQTTPTDTNEPGKIKATVCFVFLPAALKPLGKQYWQHTGEGISSRLGEYCLEEFSVIERKPHSHTHGDYKDFHGVKGLPDQTPELGAVNDDKMAKGKEFATFVEERFGRNLDLGFATEAKDALKKRISGQIPHSKPSDVYLYPTGMTAIFSAHRALLETNADRKSICFGFPYVDTLNILRKWGSGVHFLGNGEDADIDEVERLCKEEPILALFCEVPSNPLLKTPDMKRLRVLADKYDFAIVVDDTVGNLLNIDVHPYADAVASSLTKVFSGDSNVMGGCVVLNSQSKWYTKFQDILAHQYEDTVWAEDAIYLERNSRDFAERNTHINQNAEAVVKLLEASPLVKQVFYPQTSPSAKHYEAIKRPGGGYGGLLSITLHDEASAKSFFDTLATAKGPSLGTNFTLTCPYAILAHYGELDWVETFGVDRNLVRISVGLEPREELLQVFQDALNAA